MSTSPKTVELLEYGAGNTGSIQRCLERLDIVYQTVGPDQLPTGKRPLVMPGVGAFGAAMTNLNRNGLSERVRDVVRSGTPFLGICVGLQVLLEGSEEAPGVPGLGLVKGMVKKFSARKVPQIGWNYVSTGPAAETGAENGYVYFVNSFYPSPLDSDSVLYEADYEGRFCAALKQDNITAFQFHPEKSGPFGHTLIRRWMDAC
ncbi:MAG: imidazole glycerol phosphate synthase subunit HisH [Candidatus Melainabacteria bacterium]